MEVLNFLAITLLALNFFRESFIAIFEFLRGNITLRCVKAVLTNLRAEYDENGLK